MTSQKITIKSLDSRNFSAYSNTLKQHLENNTDKIGSIVYCLGGKLAYLMATHSEADCNVSY